MVSIAFKTINKLYYALFNKYKKSVKFITQSEYTQFICSPKKHYILVIKGALILETKFSGILEEYYLIFNSFEEYGRNSNKQNLFSYDLINFKSKLKNIIKFYIKLIK